MTQVVVYAVCALLILILIKDINPTVALLGGVFITVVLTGNAVSKIAGYYNNLFEMVDDSAREYLTFMLKVAGVAICSDVGADLCVQLGYTSVGKSIALYGKCYMLVMSFPFIKELLESLHSLF